VVVGDDDDVGPGAALDGRRHASLDVVLVDALDGNLDAGLLAELLGLGLEERVGGGNEVRPLQQVQTRALRVGRRPLGGEDALDAGGRGRCGQREEVTAAENAHGCLHALRPRWRSAWAS
jgi:hypothetical protein